MADWRPETLARIFWIAAVIFVIDRASKIWVVSVLDLPRERVIPVIDPYLTFVMAWNQGINFGLFDLGTEGRWILIALALAICAGLIVWARRARGWLVPAGVGLVTGGAVGNVWDRVQWGAVADFVNMTCCGIRNPYAFNIADVAIFAGVVLLILAPEGTRRRGKG